MNLLISGKGSMYLNQANDVNTELEILPEEINADSWIDTKG